MRRLLLFIAGCIFTTALFVQNGDTELDVENK